MLVDEKILVTGPAGRIGFPLCRELAKSNAVWGIGRFTDTASREKVEAAGVTTRQADLASGQFGDLPTDFTYVLHLAAYLSSDLDYDAALRVNGEGTGLLLAHCRKAKAALVMSTVSIYKPQADPWHAYLESEPLGDSNLPSVPTYSVSKIGQEAVARTCARLFDLPVVIVRMNAAYGLNGGLPAMHLDAVATGKRIRLRSDPNVHSPIHERDMFDQLAALIRAASVPANIVNWGGDEAVSSQQWCAYFGELLGVTPQIDIAAVPGTHFGTVADNSKRLALTGPCSVGWREGMRELFEARSPGWP